MGAISAFASGPAKRWTALISGGAYAFLAVVVLLLRPWVGPTAESCEGDDLRAAVCDLADLAEGGPLALTALGVLAVVVATGLSLVVAALAVPLLQLLAGTSLPTHGVLVAPLVRLALRRQYVVKRRLTALTDPDVADAPGPAPTSAPPTPLAAAHGAQSATRVARARRKLHRLPVHDDLMLPTRIGNSFAAMNGRVRGRHGMDPSVGWPLLEQLFDDAARRQLEQGSAQVLGRARNLLWAVLTVLVSLVISLLDRVHDLPAAIVAVAGCVIALLLLVGLGDSVDAYTDTVEAAVLRHHDALYEAAGWPLPADTEAARRTGAEFTVYLNRVDGARPEVVFERPPPEPSPPAPSPSSPQSSSRQEGAAP
ncbi:hypothetical protein [Streptomyces sp. NPDC059209]|uniref:hypothetical protein n=1 Tax=Streptomyces sp. NPDC059209 TaxID=3346769 RepID=UPI0036AA8E3D